MSRFTIVGDPHCKNSNLDTTKNLFQLIEEIGLPVIVLGDLFDTKEVIRGRSQNTVLESLAYSKLRWYFLVGNHDWFNSQCEAHALEPLKLLSNVVVIDKPTQVDDLILFPYIHDKETLSKNLAAFYDKDKTLFAHLEVTNFDFGNGHICTSGIPLSTLKGFKRVISGHFHKFQESGNLTYLGTPFSHSFGESDQTKYIGMYDTETNELKLAETPFPKHITVEFNCDTDWNNDDAYWDYSKLGNSSNFYRIILTGRQENIDRFPRDSYRNLNVKWITRPSDDAINNVSIDETSSNEVQFSKWATDIRKMDAETTKLGLEILEACK